METATDHHLISWRGASASGNRSDAPRDFPAYSSRDWSAAAATVLCQVAVPHVPVPFVSSDGSGSTHHLQFISVSSSAHRGSCENSTISIPIPIPFRGPLRSAPHRSRIAPSILIAAPRLACITRRPASAGSVPARAHIKYEYTCLLAR